MNNDDTKFEKLLQFFKVLGNENRLKILGFLADELYNVGQLAELLDLKEPTVSHHLSLMKELGLLTVRAEGNNRYYALNTDFLEGMNRDIFAQDNLTTIATKSAVSEQEQKVLQAYVDENGRLSDIPLKRGKRLVVLHWIMEEIEEEREYDEQELNEILERYHEDYASLRRYLIDERIMARHSQPGQSAIYWRLPQNNMGLR